LALPAFDIDLTVGAVHACLGIVVFLASLALLYASWRLYGRVFRWQARPGAAS
jgi:hypothetical protein